VILNRSQQFQIFFSRLFNHLLSEASWPPRPDCYCQAGKTMASQLQIEANRRNSHFSTGPRTPEGKSVSRFNAFKSGVHAQAQVIPGEDAAELEALAQSYHEQFQPATPLECFLVDSLIHADWQLRRLHRVEAQLWAAGDTPLGDTYKQQLDVFTRLQRRIDSAERSYYRALSQLRRQQKAEPGSCAPPQPVEEPAACIELASFRDLPPGPLPADDLPHSPAPATPLPIDNTPFS
jgi:hypothetical protein